MIDNFGWLGNGIDGVLAGATVRICLALALYLIYTSREVGYLRGGPAQNSELRRRVGHREYSLTRHGQG